MQWILKAASKDRYSIQNVEFHDSGYMRVGPSPKKEEEPVVMLEPAWWRILEQRDENYWCVGSKHYPCHKFRV